MSRYRADLAAWIDTQIPGAGESLCADVMAALGISTVEFWFRARLAGPYAEPGTATVPRELP